MPNFAIFAPIGALIRRKNQTPAESFVTQATFATNNSGAGFSIVDNVDNEATLVRTGFAGVGAFEWQDAAMQTGDATNTEYTSAPPRNPWK